MTSTDWLVIAVYAVGMVALSVWLGRGQTSREDYYVGGRSMPWWAIGISTMATQTSAISFLSVPAFVALKPGGGLTWLQYELAVPLAMIGVSMLLLPFFRELGLISIYEYLERRFGPSVRTLLSAVFLLSRALGTAVGLYASAIVLTVMLDVPLVYTIACMGLLTLVYDAIGGIRAVVWSDVLQSAILVLGIGLCIGFALGHLDDIARVADSVSSERWRAIDPAVGLTDAAGAPFWGFLVGGLFLYMAYYGADQSQVQRELGGRTIEDTRRSLYLNGFARFPLTLGYVLMGLTLAAVIAVDPGLRQQVPPDRLDFLVPAFILNEVPVGIRGLLIAALLAAAMSSLDSSLNALSAATVQDFIARGRTLPPGRDLSLGRLTTVAWGLVVTALAYAVGGISDTVIEAVNKIGSAFYGPILAAFLTGVLSRRVNAAGIFAGVLTGVGFNLALWLLLPGMHWMWWNAFGLAVAAGAAWLISLLGPAPDAERIRCCTLAGSGFFTRHRFWQPAYRWLLLYFLLMLCLLQGLTLWAGG